MMEIERLPTVGEREEALCRLAVKLGVRDKEWLQGRQFHLMAPDEIADAGRRGLDIQLHTHRHSSVARNPNQLAKELVDNRAALARFTKRAEHNFDQFCYPSGGYHPDAEETLQSLGVKSATLVEQGINRPGTNPFRLRRFLDGRSISQAEFEAYLSGALEFHEKARTYWRRGA
jgi:hypothetical protein